MNVPTRKKSIAMIALSAALAVPAAFAQIDTTPVPPTGPPSTMQSQQEQMEAARQAAEDAGQPSEAMKEGVMDNPPDAVTPAARTGDPATISAEMATDASATGTATGETAATGAAAEPAQQATAAGRQQGWEELDMDKDGSISIQEAAANPGLTQIFGDADADADGVLTVDEYRAFITRNYPQPQPE